jgi:hypothetical protein
MKELKWRIWWIGTPTIGLGEDGGLAQRQLGMANVKALELNSDFF